jgi:hypothetical protein
MERRVSFSLPIQIVLKDGPAKCTVIVGLVLLTLGLLVSSLWCSSIVVFAPFHEAIVSPTVKFWNVVFHHRTQTETSSLSVLHHDEEMQEMQRPGVRAVFPHYHSCTGSGPSHMSGSIHHIPMQVLVVV